MESVDNHRAFSLDVRHEVLAQRVHLHGQCEFQGFGQAHVASCPPWTAFAQPGAHTGLTGSAASAAR